MVGGHGRGAGGSNERAAASKSAVRQAVIDGYIHDWSASYERDDNPDIIEIKRID